MDTRPLFLAAISLAATILPCSCDRKSSPVPTASEVFRLRSECATLADKIRTLHPGSGVPGKTLSHYDPQTNRCYVELSDVGGDYLEHNLYDGQTGEVLASTIKNLRDDSTFRAATVKPELKVLPPGEEAAYKAAEDFIAKMMADDRRQ